MLQDAVGEHLIECTVGEGQIASISNHIMRLYPKLLRHLPSRANPFQRWVDSHWTIAHPGSSYAPPPPVASNLQKQLAVARGKPEIWNRIISEFAHQADI